ncbi:MAG TPA: Hsp20/alpha crystallin family protein [Nitrososphaerales archaeon]|nr:Hsp20/alpha crystallin family protein [Nitrososphaerales archaeon]
MDEYDSRRDIRDALDELDRFFEDFQKSMQDQLKRSVGEAKRMMPPHVTGFTLKVDPAGRPKIEMFGDDTHMEGFRAPMSEQTLDEGNKKLRTIFDLPGVAKENIEISTTDKDLVVKAEGSGRKYLSEMSLKAEVDPESAKADYKNGILEISFSLKDKSNKGFRRVSVE